MKVILSRKGFDSKHGGVPSPIFANGRLLSLPIPCKRDRTTFEDVRFGHIDVGRLVEDLTLNHWSGKPRMKRHYSCHVDPDLRREALRHHPAGWQPAFGQMGSAEGHLRKERVTKGDLFLFYGWFQKRSKERGRFAESADRHVIFGWLQVGSIYRLPARSAKLPEWLRSHPHVRYTKRPNSIYVACERLKVKGLKLKATLPGGGVFRKYHSDLRLTAPNQPLRSVWELPAWMYHSDIGRQFRLSFHRNNKKRIWTPKGRAVWLKTVGRGQEFVLDCNGYPRDNARRWLAAIFRHGV